MRQRLIFLNGGLVREEGPHLSALDRGFTLGDGVFDTMRAVDGAIFRLGEHLQRLSSSAGAIGLEMPVAARELAVAIHELLEANDLANALVRVTLSRGVPAERGLLPPSNPAPCLAIMTTPFKGYPKELYERGYRATVSNIRRNESSPLSRVKSCNYLDSVLARMEAANRGADEALLLNTARKLACGASSNVFLVRDETLVTPHLRSGVLDGVTRRAVLELAARLGLASVQRPVHPKELSLATEVFVTNTAVGVMPVVAIDGRPVGQGAVGPWTARLRDAYLELTSLR